MQPRSYKFLIFKKVKSIMLLLLFTEGLHAKETFITIEMALSTHPKNDEYRVTGSGGSSYTRGTMNTFGVGRKIDLSSLHSRIEPTLGYQLYSNLSYSHIIYFELPLLYTYSVLGQDISMGPSLKYLYIAKTAINSYNGNVPIDQTKSAFSYGLKLMLEKESFDFYVKYDYLTHANFNIYTNDGTTRTQIDIDMSGSYMSLGIRWKF